MKYTFTLCRAWRPALLVSICLAASAGLRAETPGGWSGHVVDARTEKPVPGFTLMAGVRGRVDPFTGYLAVTDANGYFNIQWPNDAWETWKPDFATGHFLRTYHQKGKYERKGYYYTYYDDDYLAVDFVRTQPLSNMVIRAIPRSCFVKGRALDAQTGQPLVDVEVYVRHVGSYLQGTRTDSNGEFSFPDPFRAFKEDTVGEHPWAIYSISPLSITDTWGGPPDRMFPIHANNLSIEVYDADYQNITPPVVNGEWSKPLPLLSSRTDAIHTYCTLLVPKVGKPKPANPILAEILQGTEAPAKIPQTITFKTTPTRTFTRDKTFLLGARATSGLTVKFKSSDPRILYISGNRATMKSRGTVTVTALQPGNATWKPAAVVKRKVTLQ